MVGVQEFAQSGGMRKIAAGAGFPGGGGQEVNVQRSPVTIM